MKFFANKKIFKKIVLTLFLLLSFSYVSPEPVQAGIGGELMEPICELIVGLGDGIMGVIHSTFLGQDKTILYINLSPDVKVLLKTILVIVIGIAVAVLIAYGFGVIGAGFTALSKFVAGGAVALKGFAFKTIVGGTIAKSLGMIIPLATATGLIVGVKAYSADFWKDDRVDLPIYSITPEEIISNKIPLFDVNFFNPDPEKKWEYDWARNLEITDEIKNANYKALITGTKAEANEALKQYNITVEAIKNLHYTDNVLTEGAGMGATTTYYYYATGNNVLRMQIHFWEGSYGSKDSVTVSVAEVENVSKGNTTIPAYSFALSKSISRGYFILRMIAIVGMMSVLVYVGIRILLSSTSSQKAKYKQMLGDWLVGMVLLFTMHYIMIFSNMFVEKITDIFSSINPTIYPAVIQNDKLGKLKEELKEYGYTYTENEGEKSDKVLFLGKEGDNEYIEWNTNFMGMIRMTAREIKDENSNQYIGYSLMFFVLVIYTCIFCWTYLKRVIYLAFLTIIAPLVALTYPIDKANDGKAQGFDYWFKEYIFNLLLQPMHLLIYTILISLAIEIAITNSLYALVALGYSASNAARALDKMTITDSTTTEQLLSDTLKQMSFL